MKKSILPTIIFSIIPILALIFPFSAGALPSFSPLGESVTGITSQNEYILPPPASNQSQNNGTMAGGAAWIDYDGDGDQDLFLPNVGIGPSRLFRNCLYNTDPGDPCPCATKFCDVSATSNISVLLNQKHSTGAAVGDFDGDGDDDLFVTNLGSAAATGTNTLLRNMGDGTFQDGTSAARLGTEAKDSYVAAFGDLNNDGYLDLYVGHWNYFSRGVGGLCHENDLYLNNGDGTFTERAAQLGVNDSGCTFATTLSDFDADGDLDIIVVNDDIAINVPFSRNEVYRNDGLDTQGLPIFVPVANAINMDQLFAGMGIAIGDYNNDGLPDYYRTDAAPGYLSTNQQSSVFNTVQHGVTDEWGWGAAFFDADNDGFVDLYRVNDSFGSAQEGSYYANEGGVLSTTRLNVSVGLAGAGGNGLALADYDNDGDVDVLTHSGSGNVGLYENITSNPNSSIVIELSGTLPNFRGIGSKIIAEDGGMNQMREVHSGSSHGSTHSFIQHIGVGQNADGRIDVLTVKWAGGCEERMENVPDGADTIKIRESDCIGGTVNGTVTENGNGLGGVLLRFIDQTGTMNGTVHGTVVTGADGSYSVSGLPFRTPMSVEITKPGYQFMPTVGAVYLFESQPQQTQDYTASIPGGSITGTVTDAASGTGVPNVTVKLNLGSGGQTITDGSGSYLFSNLTDYDYYVSAGKLGFSMSGQGPVTVNGQDVTRNFTANCQGGSISGRVADPVTGTGISGANVAINFGSIATTTTDGSGVYVVTGLSDYDYYVDATKPGYTISGKGPVTVNGQCVNKDFSATAQ